jgi:prevent-host-death family protein
MTEVSISEFKAKCLALLEEVRRTRKPLRVTRHGKPVAEINPPAVVLDRAAWIASMKDTFEITGDILSPVRDRNEWEALRD